MAGRLLKGLKTVAVSRSFSTALELQRELPALTQLRKSNTVTIPTAQEIRQSDPTLNDTDFFGVSNLANVESLFQARVHLGHKVGTLDDRMRPYLFGERLGVCIFDLDQTLSHLRSALNFIAHIAYRGGVILFVTNDRATIRDVERTAQDCGEFAHCRRWVRGIFTDAKNRFQTEIRFPDLLIFTSTLTGGFDQHPAVAEAAKMLIPTVGIVDSNCNPNLVTYPIPGNDDSPVAIQLYLRLFSQAIRKGKDLRIRDFGTAVEAVEQMNKRLRETTEF